MNFSRVTTFQESLKNISIPGTDLSIYLKGKEVYRHQTGYADLESQAPITPNTLYAIWSMTKIITCAAALRLYEEGRFLMTDPLYEYLPAFKDVMYRKLNKNGVIDITPCTRPIRIVDLFTMSSGLTYNYSDEFLNAAKTTKNTGLLECVNALAKDPLYFEPGTQWHYGASHEVLGAFIEALAGKPFGAYLHSDVFEPLGMKDTFFNLYIPDEKAGRIASAYNFNKNTLKHDKRNDSPRPDDWRVEWGGGGLISSVDDYALFANTLCAGGTAANGYKLLSKATVELMRTNHLDEARMKDYGCEGPHLAGYGYGLGVRTMVNRAAGGSGSNLGEFGWSGMLGTYVLMDTDAELTYVYAQQLNPSKEEYIAPRLRNIIYACI